MNSNLQQLQDYPFTRLGKLLAQDQVISDKPLINLSVGEPKHTPPAIVLQSLSEHLLLSGVYPKTKGTQDLRQCIASWLERRFSLQCVDANNQVLPVNGTREALFSFAQSCIDRTQHNPLVISPNPFYQIYEGAAILAGATPYYLPCTPDNHYLCDFSAVPAAVWQDCQLIYICTPGNPSGAVMSLKQLQQLIKLSQQYQFIIASDECYCEIYGEQAPPSLLQASQALGIDDYHNCIVFHSLSKRSNLPGLRSGFVAGDSALLAQFLQYRTYHGSAMPEMTQQASITAWNDEAHAEQNRVFYREKFAAVNPILSSVAAYTFSNASFYIWLPTAIDDCEFARQLFIEEHVSVLPGSYLSRTVDGVNPGANHVRIALVAKKNECIAAAERIKAFIIRHQLQTI